MRTNGLQKPYNGMQITTWILFPVLIAQFCLFLSPNLPIAISIPATLLFLAFGAMSLYYGYTTTKTDSIDPKLHQHLYNTPHPCRKVSGDDNDEDREKTKYCWVCQTNVYENSMHCKYCDKCVATFDHHCMWLNNCVGEYNYSFFYKTVWSTFLFIASHIISLIIYLSLYFGGHVKTKDLSGSWLGAEVPEIIVGFNIGFLVLTASAGVLVLQLLFFHISLRREGITTYQFIIRDGQNKRDKWHLMQKVKQRRGVEVKRAQNDGKCVTACWIGLGAKYCKLCDPIIPMVKEEMAELQSNIDEDSSSVNVAEDEKKSDREDSDQLRPTSSGNSTLNTDVTN
mmetsp:Transcript_9931/g.12506  ORF Transcript_9931/g.12506 Transcript_9931/m.12506 type:complete len:340 (+) Transcript_9931:151-1170(+)|eukprot:CAMPEP_0203636258 /NCGR_PEP_ID=MMETSP0088-20131115/2830_1 /ASSEMBLY_ACC=CAM_ASM_001087 /TAXON_ID=426623 /ORGANISM="Chaetoceros affinis, Strain CCMP159" /LENGTH=339 /DNA_ID=CAMNT_0050490335 /DNA_START=108 /DNA_END=1127 /DNA_ORIENTATION=+